MYNLCSKAYNGGIVITNHTTYKDNYTLLHYMADSTYYIQGSEQPHPTDPSLHF